jgi:hypothetical protein
LPLGMLGEAKGVGFIGSFNYGMPIDNPLIMNGK